MLGKKTKQAEKTAPIKIPKECKEMMIKIQGKWQLKDGQRRTMEQVIAELITEGYERHIGNNE